MFADVTLHFIITVPKTKQKKYEKHSNAFCVTSFVLTLCLSAATEKGFSVFKLNQREKM